MCRMTDLGVRYKTAISKPGRYIVVAAIGGERFVSVPAYLAPAEVAWLGKPLYAIHVRERLPDWYRNRVTP